MRIKSEPADGVRPVKNGINSESADDGRPSRISTGVTERRDAPLVMLFIRNFQGTVVPSWQPHNAYH